jgi:hypothetical protein
MNKISHWYNALGDFTFPTLFLRLHTEELAFILSKNTSAENNLVERIEKAIDSLPKPAFVGLDSCSPDDSPSFAKKKSLTSGKAAIELLKSSPKVKNALESGMDETIAIRPFRRMDQTREFRLFIYDGKLVGMSQRHLIRHFRRLDGRRDELWQKANQFFDSINSLLKFSQQVIDIYFTSEGNILIVDMNDWEKSDPLLFRKWDRDWSAVVGLKLMSEPIQLKGDVKVSF